MNIRSLLLASGIAGLFIGALSDLPFISLGNCVLCMWVWGGGILAVYMYRVFETGQPNPTTGNAIAIGALAGMVGAIVGTIISALFSGVGSAVVYKWLETIPEFAEQMQGLPVPGLQTGNVSITDVVCNIVLYPSFGAVGGWLASLIWKAPKKADLV